MFLVSSRSCLRSIHWSQVLSWEWRCSWSSADRRCSSYIWVINTFIAYKCATYIRGFTVCFIMHPGGKSDIATTQIPYIFIHPYPCSWYGFCQQLINFRGIQVVLSNLSMTWKFSELLVIHRSPVEFPHKGPVMRISDALFLYSLNKRSSQRCVEMPRSLLISQ